MNGCKSFTGANFTGFLGERFFFRTLGYDGRFTGNTIAGRVEKIFRRGRRTSVEIYIPELKRTFIYEAKQIYFRGRITKEKEIVFMGKSKDQCCGTCKWHQHESVDDGWVCVNDDSEYCTDFTDYDHTCLDWESKE